MKKQVTKIERTEFDWKAAAETKNERRKDRPKIELDQIQPERRDEIEFFIIFTNRSRIRNRREDKAHQRTTAENNCRSAPVCFEVAHDDSPRLYQRGI